MIQKELDSKDSNKKNKIEAKIDLIKNNNKKKFLNHLNS
jgi:hypothetical protein